MEKKSKNSYCTRVLLVFLLLISFTPCSIAFCTEAPLNSSIALSFDHLFPVSYYQKGLESLMYVWQVLVQSYENDSVVPLDAMLSKLALAQFAINRMIQSGDVVLAEDIDYLKIVVNRIQGLVRTIAHTVQTHDLIECMNDMLVYISHEISIP